MVSSSLGYRLSPEEIHGENIGYLLEDSLLLLEKVLALDVDYVSISLFGPNGTVCSASKWLTAYMELTVPPAESRA